MPKRPRQHIIEDLARTRLHSTFSAVGWAVEDLDQDYGEDLLIRIFEASKATPWSFFVQSKATDHIERYLLRNSESIAFSVTSGHAKHWERFWEPVVLAVYDTKSDTTYWEIIQTFLESTQGLLVDNPRKSITVHIPTNNALNEEGLRRLRNRTRARFERFEAQKEGAQVLIEELHRQWRVRIEYEPEFGILMLPKGEFKVDASNGHTVTAFGRFAAQLQALQAKHGIEPQRSLERSLDLMNKIVSAYREGAKLQLQDLEGTVVQEWATIEEFERYVERQQELDEE